MTKLKTILSQLINIILVLLLVFMAFLVITSKASNGTPNIFGYQLKSVLSGSMEPTFKTGSIIAIDPNIDTQELLIDDVITFKMDERNLVTHRIIQVIEQGQSKMYMTKGDNNDAADSSLLLPENVVGKYTGFTIPYVGYLLNVANSKMGMVLSLIIPGVLLLIYAIVSIWQAISFLERKTEESSENV